MSPISSINTLWLPLDFGFHYSEGGKFFFLRKVIGQYEHTYKFKSKEDLVRFYLNVVHNVASDPSKAPIDKRAIVTKYCLFFK